MVDEDMDSEPDEEAIEMDIEHTAHISYDIIINQVEMSSSFFKQQQAFKMYPIYDVRPRIDDYGEIIDMAEFKKFEVEVVETEMGIAMSQQEDKKKPETMEIPSKYSVETITLECRCKVHFIDFEGRSDGKSIRNILQRVAPKRLVTSL